MDDHHVYGDPFYAPPTSSPRRAGPPEPPPAGPRIILPEPGTPAPVEPETTRVDVTETVPTVTPGPPTATPAPPVAQQPVVIPPRADLYAMRVTKLQDLAARLGLDATGKRPALIARIKAHDDASRAARATP